jgi:short-subunit dehydrogenase
VSKVLVVGATSAIAQEIARVYAARGDRLYLLGRDAAKLAALAEALGPAVAGTRAADFTATADNGALVEGAVAALGGVDVAVIAHGWLGDQLESERSFAHAEAVFAVNLLSVVSFVVPLANVFEAQRGGTLVVLSSVAGDRGRPRNYTYGAAKGALTLYLQGVRSRLYGTGVRVCTIRLGPVDTPMTATHPKTPLFAAAPSVAKSIVAAAAAGPEDVYVPFYWRPIMGVVRGVPEWLFQRFSFLSGR